jgi:1-phosphatidylinositol-4-phosphate 5-kinase
MNNMHTQGFLSSYERYSQTSLLGGLGGIPLNQMCERGIQSIEKSAVYFIGIIDILTQYNTKKKFEHMFKSIKYDGNTISCVPPRQYADRFYRFMKDAFQ